MIKRLWLIFILSLILVSPALASLDTGSAAVGASLDIAETDLLPSAAKVLNIVTSFLGIICLIIIIYGGSKWFLAMGDEAVVLLAKKTLSSGVIGLLIVLSSWAITSWVLNKFIDDTASCDPLCNTNEICNAGVCEQNIFSINYLAGSNGTISGVVNQTVKRGKSSSPVVAVANSGYKFSKWSDNNSTEASRSDRNIENDINATAMFACVPNCSGKTCGPDGCGGTCGLCVGDTKCISGTKCVDSCDGVKTVTDIENNSYNAIAIGTQCWLKTNLMATKYNNGTSIANVTDNNSWRSLTTPAYAWYNNDYNAYGTVYGALYNGYTISGGALCPTSWHIPSDSEWHIMENFLDPSVGYSTIGFRGTTIAPQLRGNGSLWPAGTEIRDTKNFSALPGGFRNNASGVFQSLPTLDAFWTSNGSASSLYIRYIVNWSGQVLRGSYTKKYGFAVRCVKD